MTTDTTSIEIFVVDAFAIDENVFTGNPAAVVLLLKDIPDNKKKKIASEMNLSETAFATLVSEEGDFATCTKFNLRWFTPTHEVNLCGHATLATAAVIFQMIGNKAQTIEFTSLSGILKAKQELESSGKPNQIKSTKITLDFPLNAPSPFVASDEIIRAVVKDFKIKDVQLSTATKKLLLRLDDCYKREDLENLEAPQAQNLLKIESGSVIRGVIVTLKGNDVQDGFDFYSRYFAPWVGIPEDPVTGSAHTVLAGYWKLILGKNHFHARQCSKRGGDLIVKIVDDRVELTGAVAHVLHGTMRIQ